MKTLMLITSLLYLGLIGVGCSKSTYNSGPTSSGNTGLGGTTTTPVTTPVIISPIAPGGAGNAADFAGGYTTDLTTDITKLRAYTTIPGNTSSLNNPTNVKINVNLAQSESGRYGGAVTISYMDNGIQRTGVFRAGMGRNISEYAGQKFIYDNDKLQSEYNYWFNFENQLVFTAFFEDSFGAITLTLTPEIVSGGGNDAEPLNVKYKGEVYFRNFKTEKLYNYRSCWFIYTGLNGQDCRSNTIQTKCGLTPGAEAGYSLLGTFTNVDIKQAFNIK